MQYTLASTYIEHTVVQVDAQDHKRLLMPVVQVIHFIDCSGQLNHKDHMTSHDIITIDTLR